jgi:hypothetical protein
MHLSIQSARISASRCGAKPRGVSRLRIDCQRQDELSDVACSTQTPSYNGRGGDRNGYASSQSRNGGAMPGSKSC